MTLKITREINPELARRYLDDGLWSNAGLREGVEHWASETPDRTAIVDADTTWTYAALEENVARALGGLRAAGIGVGDQVLLVAPLAAPAVATYLATIRLGGTVVLLDRHCGRSDVDHALGSLGIDLVVSTVELSGALGLADLGLPFAGFDELLGHAPDRGWTEPDRQTPSAVLFTSGTTSRPKAVIHCIDTLLAGAANMARALTYGPADTAFLSSPLASITGVLQLHLNLERGAAVVLENHFGRTTSLLKLIENKATILGGAPIIAEELLREAQRQNLTDLPLRVISLGGAMIPRDLLELAIDHWGIKPVRVYGSSEAPMSTHTLATDVGDARLTDDGGLAAGTEIRIDEARGGEVLVRGPMLFLGYLHDEDNASAFDGDGWFRTGDLGRVEDGRLTITGRLKEVVARKGLKISLSEIDAIARQLPGIDEAVAYGVPDPETGERLALAIYGAAAADASFESLVDWFLDAGLAKRKLPEEFVVWDTPLPRTQSGKVQRRNLDGHGVRRLLAARLRSE